MDNIEPSIKELTHQWATGAISQEEQLRLDEWYASFNDEETILQDSTTDREHFKNRMFNEIQAEIGIKTIKHRRIFWNYAAASLIFILAGIFLITKYRKPTVVEAQITPGSYKAVLVLENGRRVDLTGVKNESIEQHGNTVVKKSNGQLVYEKKQGVPVPESGNSYNEIFIPRGGHFMVILADGSKVYLNAASSLKYPTVFNRPQREVILSGEAYFEVAHNSHKPFIVVSGGQEVRVLGTHFNINAYRDENVVKTTLLEGSVSITKNLERSILKPGQQAITTIGTNRVTIATVDTEDEIAWKNDYFTFNNERLESVMRKVSRWYNVDIEYTPGQHINENYWGSINRYSDVNKVLNMLEVTGDVRFRIKGNKIIVSKK